MLVVLCLIRGACAPANNDNAAQGGVTESRKRIALPPEGRAAGSHAAASFGHLGCQPGEGGPLDENRLSVEIALLASHWLRSAVLQPVGVPAVPYQVVRRSAGR
jgi:hypothetical protein